MIIVTYEYECDHCGNAARSTQRCKVPVGNNIPEPVRAMNLLHNELLCDECAAKARKGLDDE